MPKKIFKMFIVAVMTLAIVPCNVSATDTEEPTVITDPATEFIYTLLKDNQERRAISYYENGYEVVMTYDKIEESLTVDKTKDGVTTTQVFYSVITRTIFSPWNYEIKGTVYTLYAVINGKESKKVRMRSASNSANLDRFCDAIDDMVDTEKSIIASVGLDLLIPIIGAFFTGGISLVAALSAIGAGAGTLAQADHLNELYDRAKEAFLAL
ncbi:geobacillin-26 family protein [uncultured Traorella sp.]|uniref:geobacillin-26 family protein n=1 Tax=uncultured Traorella sp. TaxID=1929048 RepID=UPI0025CD693F|nr:geobacillin-26 family protein [uncultured Traorella sp.]